MSAATPPRTRSPHALASLLLTCACLALCAFDSRGVASAQEQDAPRRPAEVEQEQEQEEEKEVAVYGRAVFEGTNRPVRRAQVMLLGGERAQEHQALTDDRGRFRIEGVAPGRYFAFVNLPGMLSPISFVAIEELRGGAPDFDRPELRGFFEEAEVDGKADKEVTVYARRGAAIGGKVAYANGDPAVNARVHVLRHRERRLTKFVPTERHAAILNMTTDDRGRFRVAGLPPGEYVVGVSEMAVHGDGSRPGYTDNDAVAALTGDPLLMTYHPSASRAAEAVIVKVAAGDERDGVDITIPERELRALAGVVRARDERRPLSNVTVILAPKSAGDGASPPPVSRAYGEMVYASTRTDAEGRWRLKDIPDGEYTLYLTPSQDDEPASAATHEADAAANTKTVHRATPRRKKKYTTARRELRVAADVGELVSELGEGGRVSGGVAVEGGDTLKHSGVSLTPLAPHPVGRVEEFPADRSAFGGEFFIDGVAPGKYRVHPYTVLREDGGGVEDLYVKSITWNGRDLLREPLEVAEGANIEGVRVVYARGTAWLNVRVLRPGDRRPVRAALVLLLPPDASGWSPSAQTEQCHTGEDGACYLRVAPGDYTIVLFAHPLAAGTPDFEADLKRRAPAAPRLTLRAAETRTFELTLPEGN